MNNSQISLQQDTLCLSGDITFSVINNLVSHIDALNINTLREINCEEIGNYDSSTIALLILILRRFNDNSQPISITSLPDGIKHLASLYGLDLMLNNKDPI